MRKRVRAQIGFGCFRETDGVVTCCFELAQQLVEVRPAPARHYPLRAFHSPGTCGHVIYDQLILAVGIRLGGRRLIEQLLDSLHGEIFNHRQVLDAIGYRPAVHRGPKGALLRLISRSRLGATIHGFATGAGKSDPVPLAPWFAPDLV